MKEAVVQSSFFGYGHPVKESSADGHVLKSGQHWLPPQYWLVVPGHSTGSPT
jgi:hypothetical protein